MNKNQEPELEQVSALARRYFRSTAFQIEREPSGVSTYVYRIATNGGIFYLRILPEQNMSFAPEVLVHRLLLQKGVQVPEVLHFEPVHEELGLSVMLVREIPGVHAGQVTSQASYERVMENAGSQLALVHGIPVDGFGWIRRGRNEDGAVLRGENRSADEHLLEFLEDDVQFLSEKLFSKAEGSIIRRVMERGLPLMGRHEPRLVHGDFDDSHIFQDNGTYTGIIDFGEIQGSSPLYDLGHFKLHDGQRYKGFPALSEGYRSVVPLTAWDQLEIDLWAVWIGVRRLGIVARRSPHAGYVHHLLSRVRELLDVVSRQL